MTDRDISTHRRPTPAAKFVDEMIAFAEREKIDGVEFVIGLIAALAFSLAAMPYDEHKRILGNVIAKMQSDLRGRQ